MNIPSGVQQVTLHVHNKLDEKNQNMVVWFKKMVLAQIFAQFTKASKGHSQSMHIPKKSAINML